MIGDDVRHTHTVHTEPAVKRRRGCLVAREARLPPPHTPRSHHLTSCAGSRLARLCRLPALTMRGVSSLMIPLVPAAGRPTRARSLARALASALPVVTGGASGALARRLAPCITALCGAECSACCALAQGLRAAHFRGFTHLLQVLPLRHAFHGAGLTSSWQSCCFALRMRWRTN